MNLPNILTVLRIVISPFIFFAVTGPPGLRFLALILFAIGSFTDYLDGYFARKNKQVSGFGQFLDPIADKLLAGFALVSVSEAGFLNVWLAIGMIIRDVLVTSLRLFALSFHKKILPTKSAKIKTMLEMVVLTGIFLFIALGGKAHGFWAGDIAILIVLILAWITAFDYFWKNRALIGLS